MLSLTIHRENPPCHCWFRVISWVKMEKSMDFIVDVQKNYTYDLVPMIILSSLLLFFSRKETVRFSYFRETCL